MDALQAIDNDQNTAAENSEELLALLLAEEGFDLPQIHTIPPRAPTPSHPPLSFAQERLWFLDQLEPGNPAYHIPVAFRLTGVLDQAALERSLNEIIRRHEILRTTFEGTQGRPCQVIAKPAQADLRFTIYDLRSPSDSNQAALRAAPQPGEAIVLGQPLGQGKIVNQEVKHLLTVLARHPFDLTHGPLVRASLLHVGDQEWVLVLVLHHIVADGWSLGVLARELSILYAAFVAGAASPLPELPIQYADFAVWQREFLQGNVHESQLAYWRKQLSGTLPQLSLPSDRARPAVQSYRGESVQIALPQNLSDALKTLSLQEGATLFMTGMAAYLALLYRYTGQTDLLVGSPIAGRTKAELEGLIGFFVNTLVLRTDLSGDPTFRALLSRVRTGALSAYAHQDLPFERLVQEMHPERDPSRTPLFQVMFALQNTPAADLTLPHLSVSPLEVDHGTAKFDLALYMTDTPRGAIQGELQYNSDLFDSDRMSRMLNHFQTVLESVVADPDQHLSTLPLLSHAERQQVLIEWNQTEATYGHTHLLHHLFEERVAKTPDAIAVVFNGQHLTYRELNCRANQLAHYLQALGVRPDVLVGLCLERSLEMVIGLVAILKAGGAYIPLDPGYPPERLAFMLADAQMPIVLTVGGLIDKLPAHQARIIALDVDWERVLAWPEDNPESNVTGENLAYVIYTSGSTGQPKGAMNTHAGICNRLLWMQDAYPLTDADVVLQKTPFSFDVSVWEFFWPLLAGARLVVAQPEGHKDNAYLVRTIGEQQITTIHFVPSMLQVFLDEPGVENCTCLRRVICSGEALPFDLQQRFFARLPAALYNLYGPTEAAIDVTHFTCVRKPARASVPIGRPIANTQVYILDAHLQPVPVGIPGELHIAGFGLARGYLNRPELTARAFIPHPFSDAPGARLYKTGDLARYQADGAIEFLGRLDHQVKVRGFRIELGEIETVLGQHAAVRETVVVTRAAERSASTLRLVAYVVLKSEARVLVTELRQYLQTKLPDYMVPAAFVFLQALPRTSSGKVDRAALPALGPIRPDLDKDFVAPQTSAEETLARIWAAVLGLERVGVQDNFFELGGDSILSIQIIARANAAGLHLSPKQIFQHQTIAELAAMASTALASEAKAQQDLVTGPAPLTPIQHWFFEQQLLDPQHWNQALLFEVQRLDFALLQRACQQLVIHHDALRLRFIQKQGAWQQFHGEALETLLCTPIDLSALPWTEAVTALEEAAERLQAGLNLTQGPLIQVAYFDLGPHRPARLLMIIHHLVVDSVSFRILLEDLQTAYGQLSLGQAIQLPPKTTAYQHWAQALAEYAHSPALMQEAAGWLALAQMPFTPLPVDYPTEGLALNTEGSTSIVTMSLSAEETRSLLQDVPVAYHTQINDVLLTALLQACTDWSGARSLLIDLEGHGREAILDDIDLSRTVGWFTSIFPLRLELPETGGPEYALKSVKEQLRRHTPTRGIGYGVLRYLSRDPAIVAGVRALPQPEISFNYLGQFNPILESSFLIRQATESSGSAHSPRDKRRHLLDVEGTITGGELHVTCTFSRNFHRRSTIERLAQAFAAALRTLISAANPLGVRHCQSPTAGGYTPSDFPLARIDQSTLDAVLGRGRQIEDLYPLSPGQQDILHQSLNAPTPGTYIVQWRCMLEGELDVPAFQRAWQIAYDRYPILRTSFLWEGLDEPLQMVHASVFLPWQKLDWREFSPSEQEEHLERFLSAEYRRGFDLAKAPLLRLALIQVETNRYHFVWHYHHLLLDGWAMSVLWQFVLTCYTALHRGLDVSLTRPHPYREYIAWLKQQDLAKARAYWQGILQGATGSRWAPAPCPPYEVPCTLGDAIPRTLGDSEGRSPLGDGEWADSDCRFAHPPRDGSVATGLPAAQPPAEIYAEQHAQVPASTTRALQALAKLHRLTLNTLVQGAWALHQSRYSGEETIVFGTTVSSRPPALPGVEDMVGLFINTLPLRVTVSPGDTLLPWLQHLQDEQINLRQYEYSPPSLFQPWRDAHPEQPLFESILRFQNYPLAGLVAEHGGNLHIGPVHWIDRWPYPLSLVALPGEALSLWITYDRRRFAQATIARMLAHLQTLLLGFVAEPQSKLGTLLETTAGAKLNEPSVQLCTCGRFPHAGAGK